MPIFTHVSRRQQQRSSKIAGENLPTACSRRALWSAGIVGFSIHLGLGNSRVSWKNSCKRRPSVTEKLCRYSPMAIFYRGRATKHAQERWRHEKRSQWQGRGNNRELSWNYSSIVIRVWKRQKKKLLPHRRVMFCSVNLPAALLERKKERKKKQLLVLDGYSSVGLKRTKVVLPPYQKKNKRRFRFSTGRHFQLQWSARIYKFIIIYSIYLILLDRSLDLIFFITNCFFNERS